MKEFLQPKHLKLTYEDRNQNIKYMRFLSVTPSIWFDELQKRGVETEDVEGLRRVSNDKFFKFSKVLSLSVDAIATVVAVVGLIFVFFIFVTRKF